jgi:dihydroorotate dehydrogenase (fumarate)
MNLETKYLGLNLPHPLIAGASPMALDMDAVRRLEDAGIAAIVMHSLFEEQFAIEEQAAAKFVESHEESFAEATSFVPNREFFRTGPDEYLKQLRQVREAVNVPVIGSLNGTTVGGWTKYAGLIEEAGATALELNVYDMATDPETSGEAVEKRTIVLLREVRSAVKIPVAVKLSPFYTSLPNFARDLIDAGADGLVLFNRFYQPDINIEELEVENVLELSDSSLLTLRLRWLAVLSAILDSSLAVSGGVHTALDAVKSVMAGSHAVQLVATLLKNGPERVRTIREEMAAWMEEREYESLEQMRGSMNLERCPDSRAYERANYLKILRSWRP